MINEEITMLDNQCVKITDCIKDSSKWVVDHNIVPRDNKKALVNILNKYKRDTNRYREALKKRPSIAIFGESQVGKSYLVSNLAKKDDDYSLMVEVAGQNKQIDFIEKMNPPGGGKEATGLVSRFTVKSKFTQGQKPYLLKIFSQCDIVKIIANGYLSDIDNYKYEVDREEVQAILSSFRSKKQATPTPGFSTDDVHSLTEYLEYNFNSHFIIKELGLIDFWDEIIQIIPYINSDQRYEVFELIWGKQTFFTNLFKKCSQGLKEINYISELRCGLDALTPNRDTLIDVQRLRELFGDGEQKTDVDVYNDDGKIATLSRSILSAITAEVVLPLPKDIVEADNRKFLKEADILDFPGARSRNIIPEATFIKNTNDEKLEVFLRGKVAYLFDRYNYNFEISTLMYCMHNKQSEVQDIPRLVYEWISTNHGNSPEEREKREDTLSKLVPDSNLRRIIPLLVVQTKFNIDIKGNPATDKDGQPNTHNWKWDARIDANFNKFMIKPVIDKWPNMWNKTDGSFKNIFLLRDPKWSQDVFDGLSETAEETGINQKYIQKVKDMKESFLTHDYVKKHFRNPEEAWEESCVPGKSGINYIVKYLTPTCNPKIRLERLKTLIYQQKDNVYNEFDAYADTGDLNTKIRKAKLNGGKVFMFMMNWVKKTSAFGFFIDKIIMTEPEAWKVYWTLKSAPPEIEDDNIKSNSNEQLATLKQFFEVYGIDFDEEKGLEKNLKELKDLLGIEYDEDFYEILKTSGIDIEKIIEGTADKAIKSESLIYAEMLIEDWLAKILKVKNDMVLKQKGLTKEILNLICDTIDKSKERVGLKYIIEKNIYNEVENFASNKNYNIVADISSKILNDYVNSIGWKFIDENKSNYPKIRNTPIFTQEAIDIIEKEELNIELDYPGMIIFNQWIWGLRESFIANVLYEENVGNTEDALIKQKIAEILKQM